MGMNTSTSMTIQMPMAIAPPPQTSPAVLSAPPSQPTARPATAKGGPGAGLSAIRRISSGLTASGKIPAKPPATKTPAPAESKGKKQKAAAPPRAAGGKRKRVKGQDDDNASISSVSEMTEQDKPDSAAPTPPPLTKTKSGRHVQKPTTYNPAAMDASTKKRVHYGKRTAEQALCKKCTRMHSPASNQMVFCDGCNDGWHQLCHDPWIDDAVVQNTNQSWFCAGCTEKRNRHLAKKQKVEQPRGPPPKESWASKTPQQRRAYLLTLSHQELVAMLMLGLELHPDMPIFPSAAELMGGQAAATAPRSLFAGSTVDGLFPRSDANPTGQINYIRKATNGGGSGTKHQIGGAKHQKEKEGSQEKGQAANEDEDEEYDPLAQLWPQAGRGLHRRLLPDTQAFKHLADDDDFEAFSVIVYDDRGRKIEENGMKV